MDTIEQAIALTGSKEYAAWWKLINKPVVKLTVPYTAPDTTGSLTVALDALKIK